MSSSPLVSVIVPVYNRSNALRPTLDSVLAQTFPHWELLLVDDGSTDNTAEVIAGYNDPRVIYLYQQNAGGAAARNHGMRAARGKYLAFLDHDDRWLPDKLEQQVAFLEAYPDHALVYGRISATNETDEDLGEVHLPVHQGWVHRELLSSRNFIFTMSNPLLRADRVRDLNGMDAEADISDDWDLFLRLARTAPFGYLDRVLIRYNFGNPQQQTRDAFRVFRSERRLLQKHLNGPYAPGFLQRHRIWAGFRRRYAEAFREQAWRALNERQISRARDCYLEAGKLDLRSLASAAVLRDVTALSLHLLGVRKLTAAISTPNSHG